jgi:molybdopterin-guanine dinucleotide biosynthesis protein A
VGGERVADRVIRALRAVSDEIVSIANDAVVAEAIGVPSRPDSVGDLGPLAGIDAALAWALERKCDGIIAVACDMPFVSFELLQHLIEHAALTGADAVLPESHGPRGVEPLTAFYRVTCLPSIAAAVARGDNRLIGFHRDIRVARVPLEAVRMFGDPDIMFMNMNTPSDRDRADEILRGVV